MKFKRNNEPRVPWIYLQELSLLLDYKHSTIPNDLVALCTIHHTKHQKHTTLCASWWSWINFLSITLSFQLQYSSVIRESIFKRLELSWIASITSERCSNISSRSDELILERKKKAHSGTWTHNLLLRRQAPYPIRLCVLANLSLPVQINEAPTKSTQRKLMKETENEKKLRIAVGKYTRYALVSPVR